MRPTLAALATVVVLAFVPADAAAGDHAFAESFESGQFGGRLLEYSAGATTATVRTGDAADGTHFVDLMSERPNHARLVFTVPVQTNTTYRFSASVRTSGADATLPAVLGVEGATVTTPDVATGAGWQYRELYVRSGDNVVLPLTIGLGFFGRTVVGTADFDDVVLDRVETAPAGATTYAMASPEVKPHTADDVVFQHRKSKAILPLFGVLLVLGVGTGGYLVRHRTGN